MSAVIFIYAFNKVEKLILLFSIAEIGKTDVFWVGLSAKIHFFLIFLNGEKDVDYSLLLKIVI